MPATPSWHVSAWQLVLTVAIRADGCLVGGASPHEMRAMKCGASVVNRLKNKQTSRYEREISNMKMLARLLSAVSKTVISKQRDRRKRTEGSAESVLERAATPQGAAEAATAAVAAATGGVGAGRLGATGLFSTQISPESGGGNSLERASEAPMASDVGTRADMSTPLSAWDLYGVDRPASGVAQSILLHSSRGRENHQSASQPPTCGLFEFCPELACVVDVFDAVGFATQAAATQFSISAPHEVNILQTEILSRAIDGWETIQSQSLNDLNTSPQTLQVLRSPPMQSPSAVCNMVRKIATKLQPPRLKGTVRILRFLLCLLRELVFCLDSKIFPHLPFYSLFFSFSFLFFNLFLEFSLLY
jgi:hypothetical protein